MQAEIRTNYNLASAGINQNAGASIATVAPVGDAFELTGFDPTLYDIDQSHPSALGSRLSAMVIYRTIYNEQVGDISYSDISNTGISEAQWVAAQGWADTVAIVPVHPAVWLFGSGLVGLVGVAHRRKH